MNLHVSRKSIAAPSSIGTAAAGGGLALGLDLPFGGPAVVRAQLAETARPK